MTDVAFADTKSRPDAPQIMADDLKQNVKRIAAHCAKYRGAIPKTAYTQVGVTLVLFLVTIAAMFETVRHAYWVTLLLSFLAAGLVIRLFIIQHDCGHGSFLKTPQENNFIGRLMSVFTITPYGVWRRQHAIHHATSGNLDKRGVGDITTLTVKEYRALSPLMKFGYRIYRNPIFLFGIAVPFFFMFIQRQPFAQGLTVKDSFKSIMGLNIAMLVFYGSLVAIFGWSDVLFVFWPILHLATAMGGWLFFIQHQFEESHWEETKEWDFQIAAVYGSSYYVLHPVLAWFSGDIGLHHIHHLNSMIPNYRLSECLNADPALKSINRITLKDSFTCAGFKLWDQDKHQMVSFKDLD
ncbi:MAG: fatty acid desaturase family protein [Hyphomicrobiaceae bacterium]